MEQCEVTGTCTLSGRDPRVAAPFQGGGVIALSLQQCLWGALENRSCLQMFKERGRAAAGEQQRCQETGQAAEQQQGSPESQHSRAWEESAQAGAAGPGAEGLRSAGAQ